MPSPEPVELIASAFDVYRRFAAWLKDKGVIRLAEADDAYDDENSLASCLRGCLGIGRVVEMTAEGDIQVTEEDQDHLAQPGCR